MLFEERFSPAQEKIGNIIYNEHLTRYEFAKKFVANKKVLDIASGNGYGTKILAEATASEVIGMDIDEKAVEEANKIYELENLKYKVGSAEEITEADKSFEVITSFETIEHLHNQEKYLSELKRVVTDDGLVFISTPNKEIFGNKNPFHIKELTRSEFEEILKKYFPCVIILEQGNGIVSFLKVAGEEKLKEVFITNVSEPLYFLAVCSKREISENDFKGEGVGSINVKALERLRNNPVMKLSDKIYPLVKKFLKK